MWADITLQELAEANGWVVASTALAVASLADPTGVVGAMRLMPSLFVTKMCLSPVLRLIWRTLLRASKVLEAWKGQA